MEVGYSNTTFKKVAAKSGVTPAAIYSYFSSKPDLYVAVFEDAVQGLLPIFQRATERQGSLKDNLRAILMAAVEMHENDISTTAILAATPIELRRNPELAERLVEGQRLLTDSLLQIFQLAINEGEVPPEHTAEDLLLAFIGGPMGMALYQYGSGIGSMRGAVLIFLKLVDNLY